MSNIFQDTVTKWGRPAQVAMAIEECAELIVALSNWKRGRGTALEVCTEIADVEIMCRQMREIFGYNLTQDEYERKLKRLHGRVYDNADAKMGGLA